MRDFSLEQSSRHFRKNIPPVADGVDGPLRHQLCQNEVVETQTRERSVKQISRNWNGLRRSIF